MDPISFWRRYTHQSEDSSSAETTFLDIEAVYSAASDVAVLSMQDENQNGVYASSADITPGSFSTFTPSVEPSPNGKINLATKTNNKPSITFREPSDKTELTELDSAYTYASDHFNVVVNIDNMYWVPGVGDYAVTSVSTDGGVTWNTYTQLVAPSAGTHDFGRSFKDIIYHQQWNRFVFCDSRGGVHTSADNGQTWNYLGYGEGTLLEVGDHLYILRLYYQSRYIYAFDLSGNRTTPVVDTTDGLNWSWPSSSKTPSASFTLVSTTNNLYRVNHSDVDNPLEIAQSDITGPTTKFATPMYWVGYDYNNNRHWLIISDAANWSGVSCLFTSSDGVNWTESSTNFYGAPYFMSPRFDRQLNQIVFTNNSNVTLVASTVDVTNVQFTEIDNDILGYTWLPTGAIWTERDDVTNVQKTFRVSTLPPYSSSFDPTSALDSKGVMWTYKKTGTDEIIEDVWVTRELFSTDPSVWTYITTNLSNAIVSEFGISRAGYTGTDRRAVVYEFNKTIAVACRLYDEGMVVFESYDDGASWTLVYNGYRTLKRIIDVTATDDDRWYDSNNVTVALSSAATEDPTFDISWGMKTNTTSTSVSSGLVQPGLPEVRTALFKINGDTSYYWPANKYRVIKDAELVSWEVNNPTSPGSSWYASDVVIVPPVVEGLEPGDIVQVQIWVGSYAFLYRIYADFTVDTSQQYLTTCTVASPGKGIQSQKVDITVQPESGTTNGNVRFKAATNDNRIPKNFSKTNNLRADYLHSIPANYTINDPLITDSIHYGDIIYRDQINVPFTFYELSSVTNRRYLSNGTTEDPNALPADSANPRTIVTGISDVAPVSKYVGAYGYFGGSYAASSVIKQEYFESGNYNVNDLFTFLVYYDVDSFRTNLKNYVSSIALTSNDIDVRFSAGSALSTGSGVFAFEQNTASEEFFVTTTNNTYYNTNAVPNLTYTTPAGDVENVNISSEFTIADYSDKSVLVGNRYMATSTDGSNWTVMKLADELGL